MEQKELLGQFNLVERRDGSTCIIVSGKLIDTRDGSYMCDVEEYDTKTLKKIYSRGNSCDIMKITTTDGKVLYQSVEWEKVETDTKVLVSHDGVTWYKRHFASYEEGEKRPFYTYMSGRTSWTDDNFAFATWEHCKLAE